MDIESLSADLKLHGDGVWYSAMRQAVSYPEEGNAGCFAVEDRSFWFQHRNACIAAAVGAFPPHGALIDIGGGNGYVARGLEQAGFEVVLMEPGPAGVTHARARGLRQVICATLETANFRPASLPAVGLFDVIEHIEEDLKFLSSIGKFLRPGGYLYATVPAHSLLWSAEDLSAGHFRRYTKSGITALLARAGFAVEFSSYIFRPLPLPILLMRSLPRLLGMSAKSGPKNEHAPAGKLLNALLNGEIANIRNIRPMRFGASCLVVAKTPQ
ncbi:class I SAM-dependent methyltransferase [Pseudoxanthomonas sacheonensis]|uniref:class I SAM-dependent methyltransferase n=1 Tax=Pseudoxanthomonas sacheonensis TaxID=443615 RepID=UPI0013D1F34A|nr:class I SAM-dependent methyltransferase [Pseudoxanthomonas sacheonensis]KAF1708596.1 hypothetical protein CSC73_07820 [Pseudoxanthomonas sacheonensis]